MRLVHDPWRIRIELRRNAIRKWACTDIGQSSCHRREAGGGAGTRTPTPAWPASSSWTSVSRGCDIWLGMTESSVRRRPGYRRTRRRAVITRECGYAGKGYPCRPGIDGAGLRGVSRERDVGGATGRGQIQADRTEDLWRLATGTAVLRPFREETRSVCGPFCYGQPRNVWELGDGQNLSFCSTMDSRSERTPAVGRIDHMTRLRGNARPDGGGSDLDGGPDTGRRRDSSTPPPTFRTHRGT